MTFEYFLRLTIAGVYVLQLHNINSLPSRPRKRADLRIGL